MKKNDKIHFLRRFFSGFKRAFWGLPPGPHRVKGLSVMPATAWIGSGWVLAFFALLALLDFHPIVRMEPPPSPHGFPWEGAILLLVVGLVLMAAGYRRLPKKPRTFPELGHREAGMALCGILALGAFLRLYHLGQAPAPFWDDWADGLAWVHIVLDKDRYFWMFPTDGREPFLPYVLIGLMSFLPDSWSDLVIKRVAGCLIDLAAIWLLYLAGKELVSRRAGLAAAALGAVGRPMLQMTLTGMRAFTLSLAVSFLLLASVKLFRKPTLRHFLLWGFALAFGVHTYSSFRCFMIAVPLILLPWALREKPGRGPDPLGILATLGALLLLAGVYSGTLAATFPPFSGWRDSWDLLAAKPWAMGWLFALCLGCAGFAFGLARRRGWGERPAGWALAVSLGSAIVYPLSRAIGFNERLAGLSPFQQEDLGGQAVVFLLEKCWVTLKALFFFGLERSDLQIACDPFFDLFSQAGIILALGFLASRWNWKGMFLLACGAVGVLVYVLSNDPASTKLMAAAPSLYLLSGWAVSALWSGFRPSSGGKKASSLVRLFPVALAFFVLWGTFLQFRKIHGYWWAHGGVQTDTRVARQVEEFQNHDRVYLAPSAWFFGGNAQFILNEGRRYFFLKTRNAIPQAPGESPEDILVLVFGTDQETPLMIHRDFPGARWEKVEINPDLAANDPNPELYFWRVFISEGEVTENPKALLYRKIKEGPWLRRYYDPVYGWGLSGIVREARVGRFDDPVPQEELKSEEFKRYNQGRLVQTLGNFASDEGGEYEWSINYTEPIWFQVDGKTYWKKDTPEKDGSRIRIRLTTKGKIEWKDGVQGVEREVRFKTNLAKGTHSLDVRVRFVDQYEMPRVKWRKKGEQNWQDL